MYWANTEEDEISERKRRINFTINILLKLSKIFQVSYKPVA
jgi:hypothetical protein